MRPSISFSRVINKRLVTTIGLQVNFEQWPRVMENPSDSCSLHLQCSILKLAEPEQSAVVDRVRIKMFYWLEIRVTWYAKLQLESEVSS